MKQQTLSRKNKKKLSKVINVDLLHSKILKYSRILKNPKKINSKECLQTQN